MGIFRFWNFLGLAPKCLGTFKGKQSAFGSLGQIPCIDSNTGAKFIDIDCRGLGAEKLIQLGEFS